MPKRRVFIPFGEFLPDRKLYGNDGLLRAFGVTPISGNYIQAPEFSELNGPSSDVPYGLGAHQAIDSGEAKNYLYYGSETKLWEKLVSTGVETDRTRTSGAYAFNSSPPGFAEMWWFTSFGENVVATNFQDEVQFLSTPGSGNFDDMITSTFKPQGRFAFPVRQNLFLAYCFVPTTYDGIPTGTHPQLVAWSQNDNIQAFGSENVDPALIGAGYQQNVGGDLGPITAAVGGDFGLVFCAGGIVRVDGPPYEFRTIVMNDTTSFPYSVFRLGDDVYFWGSGGPSVLRGGEAPVERLATGKCHRSLLDNTTGFGSDFARRVPQDIREISGGADPINELVRWSYAPVDDAYLTERSAGVSASMLFDANLSDRRFTVSKTPNLLGALGGIDENLDFRFVRQMPQDQNLASWGPFSQLYGVAYEGSSWRIVTFLLESGDGTANDMELRTAFGRLSETHTSRIVAVRPVWSHTEGNTTAIEGAVEVQVHTKNKPWEDETDSSVHTTFNEDGWVGVDSSFVGTYHSVTLKFLGSQQKINEIHEIEGLEIEYVEGAEYGA